jgi:hypothetical protein
MSQGTTPAADLPATARTWHKLPRTYVALGDMNPNLLADPKLPDGLTANV